MQSLRGVGDYIREQRRAAQVSLRQLAKVAGVSNPYLSQIERGLRKPSAEILQQIAKGLRISAEQLYIQAGILDERSVDTEVVAAILADAALTERQKQVLLEIYDSFRAENANRSAAADTATAATEATDATGTPGAPGPAPTPLRPVTPAGGVDPTDEIDIVDGADDADADDIVDAGDALVDDRGSVTLGLVDGGEPVVLIDPVEPAPPVDGPAGGTSTRSA